MLENSRPTWLTRAALLLVSLAILVPVAWMVSTALMTTSQTLAVPPRVVPNPVSTDGIESVFDRIPFFRLLMNTAIVSVGRAVLTIAIAALAAYVLAVLKIPGSRIILVSVLALIMVPGDVFIIPSYFIVSSLKLTDTLIALILPSLFDALAVFLLYQFFRAVPRELIEAARLDGASHLRILVTIMLPLARSGIVAVAILTILAEWKELLWPMVVNRSIEKLTLGPGIAILKGTYTTDWNTLMAAGAMGAFPMIIIFLFLQKKFIASIASSGLK